MALRYPNNAGVEGDGSKDYACMQFTIFEREDRSSSNPVENIFLYMPRSVILPNTVSWGNENLGITLGKYAEALKHPGLAGTVGAAAEAGWGWAQHQYDSRSSMGIGGNVLNGLFQQDKTYLQAIHGEMENPYITAMFRGVDLRSFAFSFQMYPHDEKEGEEILKIVKEFRKAALPPGSGASGPGMLKYPREFEIQFLHGGQENKKLYKFKRSVLKDISVNYTPHGVWAMFRNGMPVQVDLDLKFMELEILLRQDVDDGY